MAKKYNKKYINSIIDASKDNDESIKDRSKELMEQLKNAESKKENDTSSVSEEIKERAEELMSHINSKNEKKADSAIDNNFETKKELMNGLVNSLVNINKQDDLSITPKNYKIAKNNIKEFYNHTYGNYKISHVNTEGRLFKFLDHKVSGGELNEITGQIQNYLIEFNSMNIKFINEFGNVYNALESLDKEYIPCIVAAVKGAEIASTEAGKANKKLERSLQTEQKIIEVLSNHKQQLDSLKHLYNIDDIWLDVAELKNNSKILTGDIISINNCIDEMNVNISEIRELYDVLSNINHIKDIDALWAEYKEDKERFNEICDDVNEIKNLVSNIRTDYDSITDTIDELQEYNNELRKQKHINDVDDVWNKVFEYDDSIQKVENRLDNVDGNISKISKDILVEKENNETMIDDLRKKLKISYALSGTSLFFVIITVLLNLMGII